MMDKDKINNVFRNFSEFVAIAAERELESFIIDANYTSSFNYRMKKLLEEIKREKKSDLEFSVLFNTKGEIALISPKIVGDFISDCYKGLMMQYYKNTNLDTIINKVLSGNEKAKRDFVIVSYKTLYKVLDELYEEIKCRKDIMYKYMMSFNLRNLNLKDTPLKISVLLILEDICKYMGVGKPHLIEYTRDLVDMN